MRNSRDNYQLHRYKGCKDTYELTPIKSATKGDVSFMGKLVGKVMLLVLFVCACIWGAFN